MTTQVIADFFSHVGVMIVSVFIAAVLFVLFRALCHIVIAGETRMEIVSTGKKAYIKKSGKKYPLTDFDVPGIVSFGPGKITVSTSKNCQTMDVKGFDKGNMNFVQINGKVTVNEIDVKELLRELS